MSAVSLYLITAYLRYILRHLVEGKGQSHVLLLGPGFGMWRGSFGARGLLEINVLAIDVKVGERQRTQHYP